MQAAEGEPHELTTALRVVLVAFLVLVGLAFILLYLRSGHTDREFAWTIKPEITAAFLGAGYGAGGVLIVASLRRRPWVEVRVGLWIVMLFTAMILVAILLHLERFHFGAASGGVARFAAWVFLAVYVFAPTVGAWLLVREQRLAGPQPRGGVAIPAWFKVALATQGGLMVIFGTALYLAPGLFAPVWPWTLTSLTAQAVASWLVPIGVGSLVVLREGDLRRARVLALTFLAYGLLQLGAVARYSEQVQWHEPSAWIWVTLLIIAVATGSYGLLATAGRTPAGQPATIR